MGPDNWGGNKVEIINNVSNGSQAMLVVRGAVDNGVYVLFYLYNRSAGDMIKLKPDRSFSQNGTFFNAGQFYAPFGIDKNKARSFFSKGEITGNCVWQNYNALRNQAN